MGSHFAHRLLLKGGLRPKSLEHIKQVFTYLIVSLGVSLRLRSTRISYSQGSSHTWLLTSLLPLQSLSSNLGTLKHTLPDWLLPQNSSIILSWCVLCVVRLVPILEVDGASVDDYVARHAVVMVHTGGLARLRCRSWLGRRGNPVDVLLVQYVGLASPQYVGLASPHALQINVHLNLKPVHSGALRSHSHLHLLWNGFSELGSLTLWMNAHGARASEISASSAIR